MPEWTAVEPNFWAKQMIDSFHDGWTCFAKPRVANFNCWWNQECQAANDQFTRSPSQISQHAFLQQCKLAKKAYFAKKWLRIENPGKGAIGSNSMRCQKCPKLWMVVRCSTILTICFIRCMNNLHKQLLHWRAPISLRGFPNGRPTPGPPFPC